VRYKTGGPEGEMNLLRLPYRVMLGEQGFAIIYSHVSQLQLEAADLRARAQANTDCPECKGKGEVPQHGGLRQKTCPRCGGRGWVRSTT
jgi:RecJ-like exonuclease